MIKSIDARKLINNGWTIKNRRLLTQRIGTAEINNLCHVYKMVENSGNAIPSLIGDFGKIIIRPEYTKLIYLKDSLTLLLDNFFEGLQTPFKQPDIFSDKEITVGNICNRIKKNEIKTKKEDFLGNLLPETVSKTMNLLYTDKYKPKRRYTEEGFPVTIVINKKTGEPVEAFSRMKKRQKLKKSGFYI